MKQRGILTCGVGYLLLCLLLLCRKLSLVGGEVLLEDALGILWVVLSLFGCALSVLIDTVEVGVHLLKVALDLFLNNLLNHRAHDPQQQRLSNVEQQLVVGLLELDVQVLDADGDIVDSDKMCAILCLSVASGKLEAEAFTSHEDIHDTLVGHGWEALLLLDVVCHILKIALDTRGSNHNLVLVLVADLSATQAEVVVVAELENVGEEVVALKDKVLNDGVDHRVRNLDTGNRDVASVLKDARDDDIGEILDEMRLEGDLAVCIVAEIEEEFLDSVAESLVLWVRIELLAQEVKLVQNAVGVISVAVAEEELSLIVQAVPLLGGGVLEDVALLLETSSCVLVKIFEPVLKLRVLVGISVDVIEGLEEIVGARRVRKTLDECLEISQHLFITVDKT